VGNFFHLINGINLSSFSILILEVLLENETTSENHSKVHFPSPSIDPSPHIYAPTTNGLHRNFFHPINGINLSSFSILILEVLLENETTSENHSKLHFPSPSIDPSPHIYAPTTNGLHNCLISLWFPLPPNSMALHFTFPTF
jgi:hypothetical protein